MTSKLTEYTVTVESSTLYKATLYADTQEQAESIACELDGSQFTELEDSSTWDIIRVTPTDQEGK